MKCYTYFTGIDIGKETFTVALHGIRTTEEFENNAQGIQEFIKKHKKTLPESLCVLEPTGGYEMQLLLTLCSMGYSVHRSHTRRVKNFIRSMKNAVKTDNLDAKALAAYGYERAEQLELFVPQSSKALELFELIQRRHDLKQMVVAEKNRRQAPKVRMLKDSFDAVITVITTQLEQIDQIINEFIDQDEQLSEKKKILKSIPGIGNVVANELLILLPELGKINRRQIASLTGLAPQANDSGKHRGYRRTAHGRCHVKPILFMAALAVARKPSSELGAFYQRLISNGKKKMVALVAVMRKIIVIANAKLKDFYSEKVATVAVLCNGYGGEITC